MSEPSRVPGEAIHGEPSTLRSRYDWSVITPTNAVIEVVAAVTGQQPTELPALYEAVEPDALDLICSNGTIARSSGPIRVSFPYAGHEVTIGSDGEVAVDARHGRD